MKYLIPVLALLVLPAAASEDPFVAEGYIRGPETTLLLTKQEFPCPSGTKRAVGYLNEYPISKFGCWARIKGKVAVVFEDGASLDLEEKDVKWTDKVKGKDA